MKQPDGAGEAGAEGQGGGAGDGAAGAVQDECAQQCDAGGKGDEPGEGSKAEPGAAGGEEFGIAAAQAVVPAPRPVGPCEGGQRGPAGKGGGGMQGEGVGLGPGGECEAGEEQGEGEHIGQQEVPQVDPGEGQQGPAEETGAP